MLKYLLVFVLFLTVNFQTVSAKSDIQTFVPNAEFVGQGRLTYMFWDVYDATLFAPGGDWTEGEPLALELKYLRDIPGKKIADRSLEEMESLGMDNADTLKNWHSAMLSIFPDVNDETTLTGILTPSGETVFKQNDVEIGRVQDPEFGRFFFNIWLSPETSAPDLRRKLLGLNQS